MDPDFSVRRRVPDAKTDGSVRSLQRYLRQLSYTDPAIPAPPVDGIFGNATRDALAAFQARDGLPVTGVADRATWEALYFAYLEALFDASEPLGLPVFPISPVGHVMRPGDRGFPVSALQYLLSELATMYDFPLPVTVTGEFDDATERAVREVERLFLRPPSGVVDKRLWNYLVGALRAEEATRENAT